jgi:hypothetical protein
MIDGRFAAQRLPAVIAGLDPAIQLPAPLDGRIKSGHDGVKWTRPLP